jgi:hypothetical protein
MFNRWTLADVLSLKQEAYVLLLLISSLLLLPRNKYLSFLLFGLATGIKHLTILIFPFFVFDFYHNVLKNNFKNFYKTQEFKKYLISFLLFLLPIVLPSISYYLDDSQRFISSILFNITRESESEVGAKDGIGLQNVLVLYNQDVSNFFLLILPRFPMLMVLILIIILLFKSKISVWGYSTLTYLTFISFNPTLYNQYMVWFFAFLPFTFKELIQQFKK